mmetsp:Transcript_21658/g.53068  ORF Transcript_21658/g.53068 Transcript_21658/m.53068 type:complete len:327 (+) Transcript_21658:257-1237(+)
MSFLLLLLRPRLLLHLLKLLHPLHLLHLLRLALFHTDIHTNTEFLARATHTTAPHHKPGSIGCVVKQRIYGLLALLLGRSTVQHALLRRSNTISNTATGHLLGNGRVDGRGASLGCWWRGHLGKGWGGLCSGWSVFGDQTGGPGRAGDGCLRVGLTGLFAASSSLDRRGRRQGHHRHCLSLHLLLLLYLLDLLDLLDLHLLLLFHHNRCLRLCLCLLRCLLLLLCELLFLDGRLCLLLLLLLLLLLGLANDHHLTFLHGLLDQHGSRFLRFLHLDVPRGAHLPHRIPRAKRDAGHWGRGADGRVRGLTAKRREEDARVFAFVFADG